MVLKEEANILNKLSVMEKRIEDYNIRIDREEDRLIERMRKLDEIIIKREVTE